MKNFYGILAYVSVSLFTVLIAAALFDKFYMLPHDYINLPIPPAGESAYQDNSQLDCMAQNIYYEAQGEPAKGKMLVAEVVIQRTLSPHFPASVCGVVFQRNNDGCQFSWTCDHHEHYIDLDNVIDRKEWLESYAIAKLVMSGKAKTNIDVEALTHYHADYVRPRWAKDHKNFMLVAKVGNHWFYRWKKAMLPKLNVALN